MERGSEQGAQTSVADEDDSPRYACSICGRSFPFQSSLSQHMRKHTEARPYKCPYCDHRDSQKGKLKVHIRSHRLGTLGRGHEQEDVEGEDDQLDVGEGQSSEAGVSECLDGCASPTKSTSACNQMVNSSPKLSGDETPNRRAWASFLHCAVCMRKLDSPEELDQHSQLCLICSRGAPQEDQLPEDINRSHVAGDRAACVGAEGEPGLAEPGDFPCAMCGQSFTQAWLLKAHTKKHLLTSDHNCSVCGRQFREAWFLKNHMKTHSLRVTGRGKLRSESDPLATINDVAQIEADAASVLCSYELCFKCGNLFHNKESLRVHEKVHRRASEQGQKHEQQGVGHNSDSHTAKKRFLESLGLRPTEGKENDVLESGLGKRISELDPVCSYQAWQLATKGKLPEVSEGSRAIGWGESLGEANTAYQNGTGEHTAGVQEKRKREQDSHNGAGGGKRRSCGNGHTPGDHTPESLSDSEYRPSSRSSRRSSQAKAAECFECGKVLRTRHQLTLHMRTHRREGGRCSDSAGRGPRRERTSSNSEAESGSASRPSTPRSGSSLPGAKGEDTAVEAVKERGEPSTDEKKFVCGLCEYVTTDSSTFASHLLSQHASDSSLGKPGTSLGADLCSPLPGSLYSWYDGNGVPQSSNPLCSRPFSSPQTTGTEKSGGPEQQIRQGHEYLKKALLSPVDLTGHADTPRAGTTAGLRDGPPGHRCSYCSYATRYPEVLWMHQTVAHKVKSGALVPRWAPRSCPKGLPRGLASWRRTGPPPSLGGKECPALPAARSTRTRPPRGQGGVPPSGSGLQGLRTPKVSHPSTDEARKNQPKTEAHARPVEKNTGNPQLPPASPKTGARLADRQLLPQEGLGFLLSSKHGLSNYTGAHTSPMSPLASPAQHSQAKPGQQDIMNMGRRGPGIFQPPRATMLGSPPPRTEVKQSAPSSPLDILSFLKNCHTHDLASLYQHWGSTNPLLTHTGMLRSLAHQGDYICQECGRSFSQPGHLRTHMRSHTVMLESNGLRGSDGHTPSAEALQQGRDHSVAGTARTAPLRKGT